MKKVAVLIAAVLLACSASFAQSNGNFSATGTAAACALNNTTGALSGGIPAASFIADISTSNGNGTTLLVRPSLVTGLFTDTKISTSIPSASAVVGIEVCVTVDGSGAGVKPASCVVYDERFQQISSQLFSQLSECTTTTACDLTSTPPVACPTNFTCSS